MNPSTFENIFVSGGAGFIGSHLSRKLLAAPTTGRLVIFDNFSSGQESYLADFALDPRVEVVRADLKDLPAVKAAMKGCDTVFHLAANPDIAKAVTQPDIDFWEGTYLAQNVLEAMRVNGVRIAVPSMSVALPVKMIQPDVGSPTTLPSFSVR